MVFRCFVHLPGLATLFSLYRYNEKYRHVENRVANPNYKKITLR
jgi:hypothetical protein